MTVRAYPDTSTALSVVELGTGTGVTTLSLLNANNTLHVVSIDNQMTMQTQAKQHLQAWIDNNRLTLCNNDALSALQNMASNSVDIVASTYTLHNFLNNYREQVLQEIFRVLKPNGLFVNGDRYALNDIDEHTRLTQQDASHFFSVLTKVNKIDLLEQWILHLISDESENHLMRESVALAQLHAAGFTDIKLSHRLEVNALVTATKPTQES
jgi:ubiquinone/menaquinone biosynthesis C-methylase UbiE